MNWATTPSGTVIFTCMMGSPEEHAMGNWKTLVMPPLLEVVETEPVETWFARVGVKMIPLSISPKIVAANTKFAILDGFIIGHIYCACFPPRLNSILVTPRINSLIALFTYSIIN